MVGKYADVNGTSSECSSQHAVIAKETGLRARRAGGRSDCQEPSLQRIWKMWTTTGSSTQIQSLQVSFLTCLSWNRAGARVGWFPIHFGFFLFHRVDFLMESWTGNAVKWSPREHFVVWLFNRLLLVLSHDVRIWNFLHENVQAEYYRQNPIRFGKLLCLSNQTNISSVFIEEIWRELSDGCTGVVEKLEFPPWNFELGQW